MCSGGGSCSTRTAGQMAVPADSARLVAALANEKKRSICSGFIINLCISPTRILGSFVECQPDPKTQVAQPNREFLVLSWLIVV